jgi:hypothetical protein
MSTAGFPSARRALQYWSIIALSIFIPVAALLGESSDLNVPMNAALLSLALLASTVFEFVCLHVWHDMSEFLCGLWLIASPFFFGYADDGQLRYWHVAAGAVLVFLAIFNLWSDWKPRRKR